MKKIVIIPFLLLMGCGEGAHTGNGENQGKESESVTVSDSTETNEGKTKNEEEMNRTVNIKDILTDAESHALRKNIAKLKKYEYWSEKTYALDMEYGGDYDLEGRDIAPKEIVMTDDDKENLLNTTYVIMNKANVMYQAVSDSLFSNRVKSVFGIDLNAMQDKSFHEIHDVEVGESENEIVTFFDIKKNFIVWYDFFHYSYEFSPMRDEEWFNSIIDKDLPGLQEYDELLSETFKYYQKAVKENYDVLIPVKDLLMLSHYNNYIFYDSKSSFIWLRQKDDVLLYKLFEVYNYDKDPKLNKMILDRIETNNGYPIEEQDYWYGNLFANVNDRVVSKWNSFKVRTGLMQFVVDNCYDEKDVDKAKIRRDRYISIMQDCFEYLVGEHWNSDDSKKKERTYETCAYMGYYLQKAYDKYVSYGNGAPRTWDYALMNALKKDQEKNNSEFIQYVRNHQYMGLDGYKNIFEKAVEGITD